MQVLMEAVGKIARCNNKLGLAVDERTEDYWRREAVLQSIKAISIIQRYVLHLHDWPALSEELQWGPGEHNAN